MHGFLWFGFHEEKRVLAEEEEELEFEIHESRERPSWFKAKIFGNRETLRNKRRIVALLLQLIALPGMMRFYHKTKKIIDTVLFHPILSKQSPTIKLNLLLLLLLFH